MTGLHDITTVRSMHYAATESPIKAKFCARGTSPRCNFRTWCIWKRVMVLLTAVSSDMYVERGRNPHLGYLFRTTFKMLTTSKRESKVEQVW